MGTALLLGRPDVPRLSALKLCQEDAPPLEGWKAPWWAEVDKSMRVAPVVQAGKGPKLGQRLLLVR